MKKNNFLLSSLVITGALLMGTTIPVYAQNQMIQGETNATVEVNGIIGEFDPGVDGPEPENPNQWIKVTLPTTALFYSTPADLTNLTSPSYTITNHSARKVEAKVANITNPDQMGIVDSLQINSITLFTSGAASLSGTPTLFTLENNSDVTGSVGNFGFSGTASTADSLTSEVNPSFDLVFQFSAIVD